MIRDAGAATSRAKRRGKSRSSTFDTTMRQEALNTLRTQMQLREAIVRQQFEVYYQPIVAARLVPADGLRGAGPLEPPQARRDRPRRVHRARRGDWPDHPDRSVRAARGVLADGRVAPPLPRRQRRLDQHQPLGPPAQLTDLGRRHRGGPRRHPAAARGGQARADREHPDRRSRPRPRGSSAACATAASSCTSTTSGPATAR